VVSILTINYGVLGSVSVDAIAVHPNDVPTQLLHNKAIQIDGKHTYQLKITFTVTSE
jgi:hypothetical protein